MVDIYYMTSTATVRRWEAKPLKKMTALAPLAALTAIVAAATCLRLWHLEPLGWMPDHYDRLIDAERIASGKLPNSIIYPPGTAFLMALPVAFFGPSVSTGQAVTVLFSTLMVPLAYLFMLRAAQDRLAALVLAGLCGIAYALVQPARAGYIDALVVPLAVSAFVLLPGLRGKAWPAFVAYGLLLALLFAIRPSNLAVALPLALYWLGIHRQVSTWRLALSSVYSKGILACGAAVAIPSLTSVLAGHWYGGGYGNLVEFQYLPGNFVWFWADILDLWISAPLLVPLALIGLWRLWRIDRPLAWATVTLLVVWPLVHSPFVFKDGRYMGLALFFMLFLGSLGFTASMSLIPITRPRLQKLVRSYAFISLSLLILLYASVSVSIANNWSRMAKESDEGLATEMTVVLRTLPEDSMLISAVSRAFHFDGLPIRYHDLFHQSVAIRNREAAVDDTVAEAQLALTEGRHVYYLISHFELERDPIGGIWDGLYLYFVGIDEAFDLSEVFVTEAGRGGKEPWVLYEVKLSPRESPAGLHGTQTRPSD